MAKIAREGTSTVYAMDGFEGRYEDLDGYTVGFEVYTQDADPAPLYEGLPDDHCQCPHWGFVQKGSLTYRYDDGTEEVIEEGEAYYTRPGHLPLMLAGTEIVEYSPTAELAKTVEVILGNLAKMEAAGAAA